MIPDVFRHYLIGVPAMDDSHWAIIQKLNEAMEPATPANPAAALTAIDAAVELLARELIEEDAWMKDIDYPYVIEHQRAHKELVRSLWVIRNRAADTPLIGLKYAINDWQRHFVSQIDQHDFQLVSYSKVIGATY